MGSRKVTIHNSPWGYLTSNRGYPYKPSLAYNPSHTKQNEPLGQTRQPPTTL